MAKNSEDLKKRIVAQKMAKAIRRLPRTWNWAAARWPRPYSGLTGQIPLRKGLAMVDQRSWVHVLIVISRGCVWEIDVWVLPALLQRLKGWGGQHVSAQTICRTLHQIGLHGCRSRRKPLLKMMHKKAMQTVCWRLRTWITGTYVLWSDETKINLFGSDGVKHVWRKSGEEYKDKCVLPTVKRGGGRVMVCGCMSAADTDICDIFTNINSLFSLHGICIWLQYCIKDCILLRFWHKLDATATLCMLYNVNKCWWNTLNLCVLEGNS